jgi:hypothetical protein
VLEIFTKNFIQAGKIAKKMVFSSGLLMAENKRNPENVGVS